MSTSVLIFVLIALAFAVPAHAQPADSSGHSLQGRWLGKLTSPVGVRGAVSVTRSGDSWELRVGNRVARHRAEGDTLFITFPDSSGTFRARLPGAGSHWNAFWIQPPGMLEAVATPIRLVRQGNTWRGTIAPLEETFTLQLAVQRGADGAFYGRFTNPERSWNQGQVFRITRNKDEIFFADSASGRVRLTQGYDSVQRTIAFDFGVPLLLRPTERNITRESTSAVVATPTYTYRAPVRSTDGWRTADARATGIDPALLEVMLRRIRAASAEDATEPLVHSVQIARHGRLVLDEYFRGYGPAVLHDSRSAFKSVVSLLTGVASDRGRLSESSDVDSLLGSGTRRGVQLRHLLSHTTGLACDDNDEQSPGGEEQMQTQRGERDWARFVAQLPTRHAPGTHYAYCSGGIHLAGVLVSRQTGEWLPALFDAALARPLGISRYAMNLAPDGQGYGGGGTRLLPRDLLKFGQLVVDEGLWNGRRVVSSEWIRRSTAHATSTGDGGSDGLAWHRHTVRAGGKSWQMIEANGNGGQLVMAIPELDLVVGFTAGSYNRYRAWRKLREEFLPQYILAAIR